MTAEDLKEKVNEYLNHYRIEEFMIGYEKKCMVHDIIKIIAKHIDENMTEPYCKERVKGILND